MEFSTKSYENTLGNHENSCRFYKSEILPNYQKRVENMVAKLRAVPDVTLNHIGMEKINGTNAKEKYLIDFASNSSFHGFNHLVARRRHPVERFLVILFIGGCLASQIFTSFAFWHRYQNEATIQTLDLNRKFYRVQRPSILICPTNQTDEQKFPATFQRYNVKDTPEARNFFQFLSSVNYETMEKTPNFDAVPPEKWLRILYDLRYEFHPILGNMNMTVMWIITERGICLSVRNYMSIYATLEYWLHDNWTIVSPPEAIPFYDIEDDDYIETIASPVPMTITVYNPGEMIEYQDKRIDIESLAFARYTISIIERITSSKVIELSVKQRKCKFNMDRSLKMWPVYTLKMCMIECRYQTIRYHCGCFPHFARPIAGVPVCDVAQLHCIANIKDELFLHKYVLSRCNCLPNCNDVHYTVVKDIHFITNGMSFASMSVFNMIINFPMYMFRREEIFGFNDFLTAVGGAAGLFLGASVLSFIEIFYYITLHMWVYCMKRKLHRRN